MYIYIYVYHANRFSIVVHKYIEKEAMSIFEKKLLYDYKHFERKHIQDLMKSILINSTSHGKGCRICTSYKLWAIKAPKNKWNRF